MSAISLKSITGITSITTPAGVDNQLTLHNNNTSEAVKLDVAGNLHINNQLAVSGIVTANTFRLPDATSGSLGRLQFGNGLDLSLFHDGNNSFLVNNTGYLSIQSQDGVNGIFIARNAEVNLYYGSSVRMQTSSAGITVNRDLDVDGHTNLDNVSIAGVSTFSDTVTGTNLILSHTTPTIQLNDSNNNPDYVLQNNNGVFRIRDNTNSADRIVVNTDGHVDIGNLDVTGDLDVDGHTNLDNVSIAGVTTFSGGIYSNSSINLGSELNFTGNGHKYIDVATLNGSNTLTIRHQDGGSYETAAYFDANGGAYLQFNGSTKFATTNTGGTVTGDFVFGANAKAKLFENGGQSGIQVTNSGSSAHLMTHDGNEDIHLDPSGYIKFEVAGPERLRIASNGSVTIGKTSNAGKGLEVYQAGDAAIRIQNNASGTGNNDGILLEIGSTSKDALIWNYESANMRFGTAGTERLRIKSDGTITINSTGTQPSGTVSGYQFDAVAATFRLGSGAGASGTTSSSISLMGSNHNSNIENGANSGAQMNLYNYNTSDGNSSAVSFLNSNGLSVSRILGLNVSHSSRTGALVFMTSNGSHPTEKLRITSTGEIKQYGFTGTSDTAADDLVLGNTTGGVNRGITIWSNSSQNGGIVFADNDSNFRGSVQYLHNGDIMRLLTAGDERVRIEPNSGIGNVVIQGEVSGGTTYGLEIIGNQETNPVTNQAGARIIAPDSRRMYFELRANDDTDHFAWLGNPDYDTGIADTVMMQLSAKGRLTIPTQPRALVKIYSTTTLGNAKITNWASPIFNVGDLWNAANSRFVAPVDGLYLVGGNFRIGAPGKIRVVRFNLQAYNTSGGHMATYGGGFGGTHNYDGGSGGYDHPYVSFTNVIYLTTGQYLELHCSETAVEHTSYIQVSNEQSAMWCVLLQ